MITLLCGKDSNLIRIWLCRFETQVTFGSDETRLVSQIPESWGLQKPNTKLLCLEIKALPSLRAHAMIVDFCGLRSVKYTLVAPQIEARRKITYMTQIYCHDDVPSIISDIWKCINSSLYYCWRKWANQPTKTILRRVGLCEIHGLKLFFFFLIL